MSGSNNLNQRFGTDAFGFTLGYFNDLSNNWSDYTAIESTNTDLDLADYNGTTGNVLDNAELVNSIITLDASANNLSTTNTAFANLYNGNISRTTTANFSILQESLGTTVSSYRYDQANRIKGVKDINVLNQGDDYFADHNSFELGVDDYISNLGLSSITDLDGEYEVNYTFDRNGNLLSLDREGNTVSSSTDMDDLAYTYTSGKNQLSQVTDNSSSIGYANALAAGNISYTYDDLGNLTNEDHPGTNNDLTIQWRIDGKVKKVTKGSGEVIDFYYDCPIEPYDELFTTKIQDSLKKKLPFLNKQ